jgi:type II secretion system protein I
VKLVWKLLTIRSYKSCKFSKNSKGFTLFEVMIALAILAIAMMASMVTTNSVLDKGLRLEEKLMAHWVGMNLINKAELKLLKDHIGVSSSAGVDKMRHMEFKWQMDITKVKIQDVEVLNINVEVFRNNDKNNTIDTISRNVVLL